MDFRQLNYILAVVEHRSITKAAKALYISQPSLSRFITTAEEELGIRLFDRSANSIALTYAGEIYVQTARNILMLSEDMHKQFRDIASNMKGRLRVGLPLERAAFMLPLILPDYYARFPGIAIEAVEGMGAKLMELLLKGHLDFIILPYHLDDNQIAHEVIYEEELRLVAKPGTLSGDRLLPGHTQTVDLARFSGQPFVCQRAGHAGRGTFDLLMEAFFVEPKVIFEAESQAATYRLAASGLGFGIIPTLTTALVNVDVAPELYSIADPPVTWEVRAIYRRGAYIGVAERTFFEIAKAAMAPFSARGDTSFARGSTETA